MSAHSIEIEQKALELLRNDEVMRAYIHQLMDTLGPDGKNWLSLRILDAPAATERTGNQQFAALIGARQNSCVDQKALELASLVKFFEYRKSLLSTSIPATTVADMLGVARQTVHDRVRNGQLLGILDNNVLKFPEWQFDPQGPNGVVEGLSEVVASLSCGTFAKISWLSAPNAIFAGLRPIDVLKNGRKSDVLHEAQAVGVS